jgi:hypothetical protein
VSTEDIYLAIIAKPNCSCHTTVGFIQDLHRYAANTCYIIRGTVDPRNCKAAKKLKNDLLELLEGYDKLKRGVPNARKK